MNGTLVDEVFEAPDFSNIPTGTTEDHVDTFERFIEESTKELKYLEGDALKNAEAHLLFVTQMMEANDKKVAEQEAVI